MGTLTLADLEEEVMANLANRDDITSARVYRHLNLAQMRIARTKRWEELEVTKTATLANTGNIDTDRFIALPTNARDIYSLVVIDSANERSNKLKRIPARNWDTYIGTADYDARDFPVAYTQWQNMIEPYPVQDATYTLRSRVTVWPTAFSAANTAAVSDLTQKDDMLIALSTAQLFNSLKMLNEAGRWWAIYKDMLQAAIDEEGERPDADRLPHGSASQGSVGQYWKDPFIRGIN